MKDTAILGALGLLFLFASACEPGDNVTFRNETDQVVIIWQGLAEGDHLRPGEDKTYSVGYFPGTTTYRVTGSNGRLLFEKTFTFEELKDYGDIVITAGMASPSPS